MRRLTLPFGTRRALIPLVLLATLLHASPGGAQAAPTRPPAQAAVDVAIDTGVYPNALCNDGSAAHYYVRKSTEPGYKRKWLIVFQGGGRCSNNETCLERWRDLDGSSPTIGSHRNMVGDGGEAMKEFDGHGILDGDGETAATRLDNPFRHFNRLHVHYCSSDSWKGRGGRQVLQDVSSTGQVFLMPIVFHGADIAEAVVRIVKTGRVDGGGVGRTMLDEIPNTPDSEVVFYGQSAGANGLASQIDDLAALITYPWGVGEGGPKVWGIIDSNESVGLPLWVKDQDAWASASYWSGNTGYDRKSPKSVDLSKLKFDESCLATYPNYPDFLLCNSPSRLLLHHISTPVFVAENAYDGVIHGAYLDFGFSSPEIRKAITNGASQFPPGTGLFIPNFKKRVHVIGMQNETFLATDDGPGAGPNMVLPGQSSKVSFARALTCYREKQNGATGRDCRFVNQTAR